MAVVVGVILLVLIIALFIKRDYSVSRSIVINEPKQAVFNYIRYLKNQDNYSKWMMMDPAMEKEFSGVDGNPGFKAAWKSNNKKVGQGEQEITKIINDEKIESKIHFIKPFEGLADAIMSTAEITEDQTSVTWGFASKMAYPMNIMRLFMNMDAMIGADLDTGLANLKALLEQQSIKATIL